MFDLKPVANSAASYILRCVVGTPPQTARGDKPHPLREVSQRGSLP
jgi:hypothetical protein